MKFLDEEQRGQIGYKYIIDELNTMTPYGTEIKKNIRPFKRSELEKLKEEFKSIEIVMKDILSDKEVLNPIEASFCRTKDIRNSVKRCTNRFILDEVELFEIKYFALMLDELVTSYEKSNIDIPKVEFHRLDDILELLDPENTKMPTFHIYDTYSEKLADIRLKKRKIEEVIYKESDDDKRKELLDQRLQIVMEEEEEELEVRKKLSEGISKACEKLLINGESIGRLDFLMAKSRLAIHHEAVKPNLTLENKIVLKDGVNPQVKDILRKRNREFTPVSIDLESGTTLITGANMGGKSVSLKTIVLNLFLVQMGFYVFAKEATMPVVDFIYYISDDMQSISKGLSTFGAEIIKLREVVECMKREVGFAALDEFARGTNPREGLKLVKGVCKYFNKFDSVSLISTHYDGVVEDDMTHYQAIGLKNVDFKNLKYKIDLNKTKSIGIIQEHMDYRLEKVSNLDVVPKDALNISILLGLEPEIINIIKESYEGED